MTLRVATLPAVAALASALALTGCTPTATPAPPRTGPTASSAPATATAALSLEDAGARAETLVTGSTLISIETENDDQAWKVQLVTPDGAEHEVTLSADTGHPLAGPSLKPEDAAARDKHKARLAAAKVGYRKAAATIRSTLPGGSITELNLDDKNGTTVWEADVRDKSGAKHEIAIDAVTGRPLPG